MVVKDPTYYANMTLDGVIFALSNEMRKSKDDVENCIKLTEVAVQLLRQERVMGEIMVYYEFNPEKCRFALNIHSKSYEDGTEYTAVDSFVKRYVTKFGAKDYTQSLKGRLHDVKKEIKNNMRFSH
ncbi:MAG: hypothetical protein AABW84_02155 [Nanoarchaeota archaeon]